jgi:hypothetical protein
MNYRKPIYILSFFSLILVVFMGCTSGESAPPIPSLQYTGHSKLKTINGKDSLVTINMTFEDGDGDIGLSDADSFPPFRFGSPNFNNLYVEFIVIDSGVEKKITSQFLQDPITGDTVNFNQRITNITPEGRDKYIKGRLDVLTPFITTLDYSAPLPDSVYYRVTLEDRSLNRSNTIQTPMIVLDLQ